MLTYRRACALWATTIAIIVSPITTILLRNRQRATKQRGLTKPADQFLNAPQTIDLSRAIDGGDIETLARHVTAVAAQLTGAARSTLWILHEKGMQWRCIDLYETADNHHSAGKLLGASVFCEECAILKNTGFIAATEAWTDPRMAGSVDTYLKPLDISSVLDALIDVPGQQLGLLRLEHIGKPRQWTPEEIVLACRLADKVTIALSNRARHDTQEALQVAHALLKSTEAVAAIGGWQWDIPNDTLTFSDEFYRIIRRTPGSIQTLADFLKFVHKDDRQTIKTATTACMAGQPIDPIRYRIEWPDNTVHICDTQCTIAYDTHNQPIRISGMLRDITERVQTEEHIQHLAYHDALTNLPNRVLLIDRLNLELARAQDESSCLALLFLDLDRFKTVNDSFGHDFGDRVLRDIATRLKTSVQPNDTVCRQGGDEFLIILPKIGTTQNAGRVTQKLLDAIAKPFIHGTVDIVLSASIGVACFPENGEDAETLLRNADAAMYAAKQTGRNTYHFYSNEMNTRAHERMAIESDLRHAIERQQLFIVYQPQVDLGTGAIVGLESLVRWYRSAAHGLVPPSTFIPIAEDNGMIVAIGTWVLETACAQYATWLNQGLVTGTIGVNVSMYQFRQPDFVEKVVAALSRSKLPAHHLEIEVTESMVMHDIDKVLYKLNELNKIGIKLTIDDFGTGYSSLSYLKQFPIDRLKIDQSFTRTLPEDTESGAIAQAIISMGHSLGLSVVAEGVETRAQEEYLRALWCDTAQGYLYAKPMTHDECVTYLNDTQSITRDDTPDRSPIDGL